MTIDNNGFLSLESTISNPKIYNHIIGGRTISHTDHLVLVRHKQEVKIINRKDLGKTMNLIRINNPKSKIQYLKSKIQHPIITLFSGFDEHTGVCYYFFPKLNGERLTKIAEIIDITIIDNIKGWFRIDTTSEKEENLLYKLFVLSLLGGKILVKGQSLLSLKIQVPIPTPFFACKETLEALVEDLQSGGCNIAGYFVSQSNGGTFEISTNDYEILEYIRQYDKSLASIEKIVTKELADQVKVAVISQYPESENIIGEHNIKLFEVK